MGKHSPSPNLFMSLLDLKIPLLDLLTFAQTIFKSREYARLHFKTQRFCCKKYLKIKSFTKCNLIHISILTFLV